MQRLQFMTCNKMTPTKPTQDGVAFYKRKQSRSPLIL